MLVLLPPISLESEKGEARRPKREERRKKGSFYQSKQEEEEGDGGEEAERSCQGPLAKAWLACFPISSYIGGLGG